jgi:hypothetical protein
MGIAFTDPRPADQEREQGSFCNSLIGNLVSSFL